MRISKSPEERKKEILDVAEELFTTKGYAETTINDILRKIGIAKGTFYYYFKSKEDLFREMARSCVSASLAEGEEFVRTFQGSTRELLEQFIRRYWAKMNDPVNLRLVRVVHLELTNFPELARFYFQEVITQMRSLIQSIIQLGIERGEFRPVNSGFAARALQILCAQLAQYQHHFRAYDPNPMSHDELQSGIIDIYLNGVLLQPASDLKEAV